MCRIDGGLLQRLERVAAEAGTTPCAIFAAKLRYLVETYESAEENQNANFSTLLAFSLGKKSDVEVLNHLGIEGAEDLMVLMARARLPMPRISDEATRTMVEELRTLNA